MTSKLASRANANARSSALQALRRAHPIHHMVLVVGHQQAGASIPRNAADRSLTHLFPDEYAALYAQAKEQR